MTRIISAWFRERMQTMTNIIGVLIGIALAAIFKAIKEVRKESRMKVKRHMGLPFRAVWVDEDFNDLLDEKGCGNCYYDYFDEKAYPCSICIRGVEREDMWQPQTERSE